MAGGGVGEAMLIGAAVGAGTGGIMSAAQDKDIGQGMLLGALGGAATGGIGSGIGGAAADVAQNIGTSAVETGIENAAANEATSALGQEALKNAATTQGFTVPEGYQLGQGTLGNQVAESQGFEALAKPEAGTVMPDTGPATRSWGQQGLSQGMFPGMTNAQVAGATTTGGISGLMAANAQPAPYEAPSTTPYTGPLSKFKLAGPQLSQYNYDPNAFKPSVAPGFADGGIATLQTGMFPQSQMDRTQFATPSQMPISREIIGSDYDQTINPYTGDLPRFGEGGGINFIHNMQPGGELGSIAADLYGVVHEHEPGFLKDIQPGGFMGALTPGKLDYEEKKRKEEEQKVAEDRAMQEAQKAALYNKLAGGSASANGGMAHGGIADLGSYSDGGRLLRGPGDGMSDNIPASIGGKQPARLADGEFVVPADVVSHLGNGSTDAGAKTLYAMMNKVRKARTGNPKQGKEINPNKYVPGMADGGIASFAAGGEVKRYATGNLVTNAQGEVGYYKQTGDNPWDSEWVPYSVDQAVSNNFTTSQTGYTPSVYDPGYYNPKGYADQLAAGNAKLAALQSVKAFDPKYYLSQNPDVAKSIYASDPFAHYTQYGIKEGRSPYEGGKAGVALSDAAAINAATQEVANAQANVDRLANSSIKYNDYTMANRPSGTAPQYYGNIYKIPEGYGEYIRPGYDQNAGLGAWNNEYGGPAAATQRQANIVNQAAAQSTASDQALQQAQAAAQKALGNEEKKRRGGIASLA